MAGQREKSAAIHLKDFSGEADLQAMLALARAAATENLHVLDLPYRLSSWALEYRENVGLWVNAEGELRAWAVMQTPFWAVDYAGHPDSEPGQHRRILSWCDARARTLLHLPSGRPLWFVNVFADQAARLRDLEAAGFTSQANGGENSWTKVLLQRSSQEPVADSLLPAGFVIRPLAGDAEIKAYVQLHQAVFESKNMTAAWRARTLRRPEYRPELDLVAAAPDGRLAAFCIGWYDASAASGQIEPLGVHADFRHQGLGRALLAEALRRLARCGAARVYVETDRDREAALDLYAAAGFRLAREVLVYRKDYADVSRAA